MDVFFQMRFAYCGKPDGILTRKKPNAGAVLDDTQILREFELLERVTLPSLAAQIDPSFQLLVLSSARMPEDGKEHLTWLLNHHLPGRARAIFARPMVPGRVFRRHMQGLGRGDVPVIQTQILKGDAFSPTFVQRLREHGIENWTANPRSRAEKAASGTFMSFRRGWTLGMRHKSFTGLEQARAPIKPFALSLVARPSSRYTPMLINPDLLGVKFPHVSVMSEKIHCLRVLRGPKATDMPAVEKKLLTQAEADFGFLAQGHKIPVVEDQVIATPRDMSEVVPLRRAG